MLLSGWLRPFVTEITDSNIANYIDEHSTLDLSKTGPLIYLSANLTKLSQYAYLFWLPCMPGVLFPYDTETNKYVRSLVGTRIIIYNFSPTTITFVFYCLDDFKPATLTYIPSHKSVSVRSGQFIALECGITKTNTITQDTQYSNVEIIGWNYVMATNCPASEYKQLTMSRSPKYQNNDN